MAGYSSTEEYVREGTLHVKSTWGTRVKSTRGTQEYVGDSRVGDEYAGDSEEYVWQGTLHVKSTWWTRE